MDVDGRLLSGKGQCFGDRSRAAFPVTKINPCLVAFDGFSDPQVPEDERWFLRILRYRTHEVFGGKQIPVVLLAYAGRSIMATENLKYTELNVRRDARGVLRPYGFQVLSSDSNGCQLQGEFSCEQPVYTSDVFRKLPSVLRGVAGAFFKRPIIMRDRGMFRGTVRLPDGSVHSLELCGQSEYALVR
jgi:hypothetical protein